MQKYIGRFRVFAPVDERTGKTTTNEFDNYLKATRYKIEVYREDNKQLAIYFPTGVSGTNIILPELDEAGIEYKLHIDGDYEKIYLVQEQDINKIHSILKFQTKGSKIKPTSVKTVRRQVK